MKSKRQGNDFTAATKNHLARSVNYHCSKCGCPTSGPRRGMGLSVTIGIAAHISAASPEGPRHDSSLTPAQRRHYDNDIWMCSNHGTLVDRDWGSYSVEQLSDMKRIAEDRAAAALEQGRVQAERRPVLDGSIEWKPPVSNETRPGYSYLYHAVFTLGGSRKQRGRAYFEVNNGETTDSLRAWISKGTSLAHEWRDLRPGEPYVVPVFTRIHEPTAFWLDGHIRDKSSSGPQPSLPILEPGTYLIDEAFLTRLHRAALPAGSYRLRVKLILGDTRHRENFYGEWLPIEEERSSAAPVQHSSNDDPPSTTKVRDIGEIVRALRQLRREVIHEILNVPTPTQETRGDLERSWIPKAQDWDARVERTMTEMGCDPGDIEFVRDFPLPVLRRHDFTYPMNSQWAISDTRREKLEDVLDGLLGRQTFRR